jgi:hypothetical protein
MELMYKKPLTHTTDMANIHSAVANFPIDLNCTHYEKFWIHISKPVAAEKSISTSMENKTTRKRKREQET